MISPRHSWWAALALAAFVGCGESTEVDSTAPVMPSPTITTPAAPPTEPADATAPTEPAPATDPAAPAEPAVPVEPAGTPGEAPQASFEADELEEIAKLSAEEQELAKAQVVCLVSHEKLGSMGKPVRVEADGKVGFLCCGGCKKEFEKDPAAAFASIQK